MYLIRKGLEGSGGLSCNVIIMNQTCKPDLLHNGIHLATDI